MNTWLTPVFIGVAPWTPGYGGRPPGGWALASGGSEHKTLRFSCLGGTGPYKVKIWKYLRCTNTAYLGKTVTAGPSDHRRTKQVGAHQAAYDRGQKLANFDGTRPQWAERRGVHGQNLGRRKRGGDQRDPLP